MFSELDLIEPMEAFDGPMQMALDEILLKKVSRPTLRFYRWVAPCVSFGYFQSHVIAEELYPELPSVRRWTGGGLVFHGTDLTFSLMIPSYDPVSGIAPSVFYRELHGSVAQGLGASLAGEAEISKGPACFSAPSMDDLMVGGRKVLGGAIRRSGGALLYQGSLSDRDGSECREILAVRLGKNRHIRILEDSTMSAARNLSKERYSSPAWNRRR